MLKVLDNDSIRRILPVRRRAFCSTRGSASPPLPCKHTGTARERRHPEGELIKNLLLTTPPRKWRRRGGRQLMTCETTVKADLESQSGRRVFGHARWRKDRVKIPSELARDRQPWNASVQEVMY